MKTERQDFIASLATLSKLIELDNFYSIGISTGGNQISLQGRFTDTTARFAREIGIALEYQNDNCMLKGESTDGTLRIVLT